MSTNILRPSTTFLSDENLPATMSAQARRSASLLAAQIEQYLSISQQPKPLQLVYSTQANWPCHASPASKQIDVGVLDSSFNPPQRAHFALAKSAKPDFPDESIKGKAHYDSLLLIFSVRNADKGTGTKKDASPVNRLEMMQEFAKDVEQETKANVAVAIVEEPLMFSKSTLIHDYIQTLQNPESLPVRLHWLVGFDTLQRFFQIKYYPSQDYFDTACKRFFEQERTTFVCARRGKDSLPNKKGEGKTEEEEENELLQSKEVKPWLDRGVIVMMDLHQKVQNVSSTAIREILHNEEERNSKLTSRLEEMTTPRVARYLVQESVYKGDEQG
jgi:nicotinamide-nucleotide adenylyltransferase